jgi:hypothetical protein
MTPFYETFRNPPYRKRAHTHAPRLSELASGDDLPLWMIDPATLSPLLLAYDRRVEVSPSKVL